MKDGFLMSIPRDLTRFLKVRKFLFPGEGSAFVMCGASIEEKRRKKNSNMHNCFGRHFGQNEGGGGCMVQLYFKPPQP